MSPSALQPSFLVALGGCSLSQLRVCGCERNVDGVPSECAEAVVYVHLSLMVVAPSLLSLASYQMVLVTMVQVKGVGISVENQRGYRLSLGLFKSETFGRNKLPECRI